MGECPECGSVLDRREGPIGVSFQCLSHDCLQTFAPDEVSMTTPNTEQRNAIEVGQQLWFVPWEARNHHRATFETVTKIGREWITMSGRNPNRFRKDDPKMRADSRGYSSPGSYYLSREAHEQEVARNKRWRSLMCRIPTHAAPDHIANEDMDAIARILKLEEKA